MEQALSRTANASLISGNHIRLLKDGSENYPAWLSAIRQAKCSILFENYFVIADEVGEEFATALMEKARAGVRVRVLYDWFGSLGKARRKFWNKMRAEGVEVRCYNPPRLSSPLGWFSRDHRKTLTIDGQVGFISGLCVGKPWLGIPDRGIEPWRDTGVELQGPAVLELEKAFHQVWGMTGTPIPESELTATGNSREVGEYSVRVLATVPSMANMYRLDQFIAAFARKRLWLTDAYFSGTTYYVQALLAAAQGGVDVRLLLPGASDVPIFQALSRTGYRVLLKSGVRLYEWNGSMLHAKTAVADGRWSRVGSTNLNMTSWFGNCEMDLVIEDKRFAKEMEEMYVQDLTKASEISLSVKRPFLVPGSPGSSATKRKGAGNAGRAVAGVMRAGNVVGAAITNHRILDPLEARITAGFGLLLVFFVILFAYFPRALAYPLIALLAWFAMTLLLKSFLLFRKAQQGTVVSQEHRASSESTSNEVYNQEVSKPHQ